MTTFHSEIKLIPYKQQLVYEALSNMDSLEKVKDQIPHEKIKDFVFDQNSCSFEVNPVGKVKFSIIEKNPPETIKLTADDAPVEVYMWIKLTPTGTEETQMQLTIEANLNPFLKPMLSAPLEKGINKIANVLETIPFDQI